MRLRGLGLLARALLAGDLVQPRAPPGRCGVCGRHGGDPGLRVAAPPVGRPAACRRAFDPIARPTHTSFRPLVPAPGRGHKVVRVAWTEAPQCVFTDSSPEKSGT